MKKLFVCIILAYFCYACGCEDPQIISFTPKDKEWLIYQKGKTFTYKNQKNDSLVYVTERVNYEPFLTKDNSIGGIMYPSYRNGCVIAKWDGMRVKLQNKNIFKDSVLIALSKDVQDNSFKNKQGNGLSPSIAWYSINYSSRLSNTALIDSFSSKSFDTLRLSFVSYNAHILLKRLNFRNGKVYNNVLLSEAIWVDYNTKITTKTKLYYHKTTGIIRFETANGDIWELE